MMSIEDDCDFSVNLASSAWARNAVLVIQCGLHKMFPKTEQYSL